MICGFLPFEDQDTDKLYKKIIKGEFIVPKFISSYAKDLLSNVLKTDPS